MTEAIILVVLSAIGLGLLLFDRERSLAKWDELIAQFLFLVMMAGALKIWVG